MRHQRFSAPSTEVPGCIQPAISPLLDAIEYADQTSGERWEFAVEIQQLISLGLTLNDFRWLVRNGFVEHRREVTGEGDDGRAFRSTGDLTFPQRTCFVLTDAGITFARQWKRQYGSAASGMVCTDDVHPLAVRAHTVILPKWDAQRRVLGINGTVVKQFKWVAVNQQTILCAFEEEGWPGRIDDPLPPHAEQDPKRRLSDTIKCLNRKQRHPILRFRGDGTGEGIIWELVESTDPHC